MVSRRFVSDRAALRPAVCGLTLICALGVCAKTPGAIPLPVRTEYRASAWLLVRAAAPRVLFDVDRGDEQFWSHPTQVALVKSRFVLNAALRKPGISQLQYLRDEEDRLAWLRRRVEVRFLDNTEIMEIAVSGDDPSQLVALVNAVKDAYMEEVVGWQRENYLRKKGLLEVSYTRNLETIKNKSERLRGLEETLGLGAAETAKGPLGTGESLADIRRRVVRTGAEIRELERRTAVLKARLARSARPSRVRETHHKLAVGRVDVQAVRFTHPTGSARPDSGRKPAGEKPVAAGTPPKAAAPKPGLSAQQRHAIWEKAMKGIAPPPDTPRDLLEAIAAEMEIEKGVLEQELDKSKADLESAAAKAGKQRSAELEVRKDELERLKKVTAEMGLALEKWEIELAAAPRVSVVEPASVPKTGTPRLQLPGWMGRSPGERPSAKPADHRRPASKASE